MRAAKAAFILAPVIVVFALQSGDSVTPADSFNAAPQPAASQTPTPNAQLIPLAIPPERPVPTPTQAEAKPTPKPSLVANKTLGVRRWKDPKTPPPLPVLSDSQQKRFGACLDKKVSTWSKGRCAELVQKELRKLKMLPGKVTTRVGVPATNSILRYQRSRDLKPTGEVDEQTWYALASEKPARPKTLPPECNLPGVVLCVDQGHEKLRFVKDGEVKKTVRIRTGGYTSHAKTGVWRVFPTANGLFKVYTKHVNPPSENYGSGAMPYSVIFDPNMYVHYSGDFNRRGYSTSSHGCVNVGSLDDAKWLFKRTPIGAHVYIY